MDQQKFELLGNAPGAREGVRDPLLLQEAAAAMEIRTLRTLAPETLHDPGSHWLKKPVKSGAGGGIATWEGAAPDDPD